MVTSGHAAGSVGNEDADRPVGIVRLGARGQRHRGRQGGAYGCKADRHGGAVKAAPSAAVDVPLI